jgi:eukaryotic-like serine/threonine-protein kinase
MSQGAVVAAAARGRGRSRKLQAPRVEPGTDVGSYLVEARLGAGGFGTVFRARRGGQAYALKLLSLEEVGEWGVREVLALSRVRHPHVVRLHGFWQWPDEAPRFHVVVMEYVEGRRLDVWTRTENPSALRALRLVLGVARALVAVHRAGVVHRDVKPANILVREQEGEAVLVDFGVSGWEEASSVTGGMMPPGTLSYRSPEAWRFAREHAGRPGARYQATPADDVYALGVVLYWLLTDTLPFRAEEGVDVEAVLGRAPEAPQVRNPRVPRELGELCLRLLEKRPERRPDAAGVCEAVEALLARQGAEWEQALCEAFCAYNVTTRPGQSEDEEEQWVRQAEDFQARRPRRGRRPPLEPAPPGPPGEEVPREGAAADAMPVVPPPAVSPAASAPARTGELARVPTLGARVLEGLGLGLVVALVGVLAFFFGGGGLFHPTPPAVAPRVDGPLAQRGGRAGSEFSLPTWEPGRKVAPPLEAPEAERASPGTAEEGSPAPVAPGATAHHEEEASVKTPQQKKPKGLSAAKKAAAVGLTCTALAACPGPQVRPPPPPPEPCPPGAVEAMRELGIKVGDTSSGTFIDESARWISVNEGKTQLRTYQKLGNVTERLYLSGRLILGERVYGRLTQARLGDRIIPVCVELYDPANWGRGLVRRDEGGGTTVYSTVRLKAVDRFE